MTAMTAGGVKSEAGGRWEFACCTQLMSPQSTSRQSILICAFSKYHRPGQLWCGASSCWGSTELGYGWWRYRYHASRPSMAVPYTLARTNLGGTDLDDSVKVRDRYNNGVSRGSARLILCRADHQRCTKAVRVDLQNVPGQCGASLWAKQANKRPRHTVKHVSVCLGCGSMIVYTQVLLSGTDNQQLGL